VVAGVSGALEEAVTLAVEDVNEVFEEVLSALVAVDDDGWLFPRVEGFFFLGIEGYNLLEALNR
jgi:hypothetical protein